MNDIVSAVKTLILELELKNSKTKKIKLDAKIRLIEKISELLDEAFKNNKTDHPKSILNGISPSLPSLLRAHYLTRKASRVGFDWNSAGDILKKVEEEFAELKEEVKKKNHDGIEEELGDLLFVLVNVGRFLGINPEMALHKSIEKFISRFHHIEYSLGEKGKNLKDASLEEMEYLWEEAKKNESLIPS